ncbi:MAG: tetratricopeptide repeat protein [Bryobacterales bacterium]|nr:tetratricopeptide repeat protein [Bryobacterales bacterium]
MRSSWFVLLLALCAIPLRVEAQPRLDMPANLEKGFLYFYNLDYPEAIRWFQQELKEQPGIARPYNHLAQAHLYRVLFRAGALESQLVSGNNPFLRRAGAEITSAEKAEFFRCIDSVLRLTDAALAKNPDDTDALYSRGIALGLRANYNFLVEKAARSALSDATEARKLHNRVAELKPDFVDARFVQGMHDYVVGSLSPFYKLLGFLVGFRGDKEKGIRTLEDVARNGVRVPYDAKVMLAAIYRREGKEASPRAIPLLRELAAKFPANHLFRLELVQIHSDLGQEAEARRVFAEMDAALASDKNAFPRMPSARLEYAKGNFNFWYRNYPEALRNLRASTQGAEDLDLHTSVLAYMRLGQVNDMMGNRDAARTAYQKAIALAPQSEAAKESRGYLAKRFVRKDA